MSAKVSVIIPIYNTAAYLPACLDSVLAQSYEQIEVLCIDDGSTDASGAIAQDYAKRDSRIHYLKQPNQGQSAARNLGLEQASGEYVAFIDSDDYIDRDFLSELVAQASSRVFPYNFHVVFESAQWQQRFNLSRSFTGSSPIDQALLDRLDFFVCNGLFSLSLIRERGLRFLEGRICEDADFLFRYLALVDAVYGIDASAYHYRQRAESTTGQLAEARMVSPDRIYVFAHIAQWYREQGVLDRGLPFQILTDLNENHHNAADFMRQAQAMVASLRLPPKLLSHSTLRAFLTTRTLEDFLLRKVMLANANPFKRYFKLRIRRGVLICVLFGRVLLHITPSH